ncbi:PH domain-containing protein [Corynebacterium guangdongense]|uniref:Membrane protein YdbS with pleckstrin-like domain n=1 Tax=Corynebacterium guangdongense TaxID=1783348 RepID=A0ABU1ZUK1_9CORY|nr:PH domain-containing protein [Corynebacterium guangdongense]MDR7328609.1 membrane protein YdbS with pleckstrin-like domain [Corynebacterium guangdongense]WJZ17186.1 Bacterial membrane flanked domain protein [Corynebacterium guangdongense]
MNSVSPALTLVRYLGELPWWVIFAVVGAVLAVRVSPWWWFGAAFFLVLFLWRLWLIPAQVRLLGWRETEDELLLTRGRLWHRFTVVPYGRIQFVDVTAGPVERAFGLKKLKLHTASATTDTTLPGLTAAEADALRERLTVMARERMSGL